MKLHISIALIILFVNTGVKSQTFVKNRLGIGVNYVTLDLPDDIVIFPKVNYQHQFNKRLFGAIELGYLNYNGKENIFNIIPETRKRITIDVSGKFTLLKYKNNYLKIEAGPSIWYRDDKLINQIKFLSKPPDYVTKIVSYKDNHINDWNLGYHFGMELEVSMGRRFSTIGYARSIHLNSAGTSSLLGIAILYKFKGR